MHTSEEGGCHKVYKCLMSEKAHGAHADRATSILTAMIIHPTNSKLSHTTGSYFQGSSRDQGKVKWFVPAVNSKHVW